MTFREIILSLILAAHSNQPTAQDPSEQTRLNKVADDMLLIGKRHPIFEGEAKAEATTAVLYAIARHESGFWAKVQDCSICYYGSAWCDHGRSITLFQLREGSGTWGTYTRKELCEDNLKATERTALVLRGFSKSTTLMMFNSYAGGGLLRPVRAARELENIFQATLDKTGIKLIWKNGQNQAAWK